MGATSNRSHSTRVTLLPIVCRIGITLPDLSRNTMFAFRQYALVRCGYCNPEHFLFGCKTLMGELKAGIPWDHGPPSQVT